MWLIVGLGNPGAEYAATRHNIGFLAVDVLAENLRAPNYSSKFQGECAQATLGDEKIILLKPQTYMNNSGRSVQAAAAFFKIAPENIIVLHDELDLSLGKLRIKRGGGANGHNGLRDIDACLGQDYWRIRLGIGHPGTKEQVHSHVLTRFSVEEVAEVEKILNALSVSFAVFFTHSPEALATKVAAALNPPKPKKQKEEADGI